MNKTLSALMTKIKWQQEKLHQELNHILQQLEQLENKLAEGLQKIHNSCIMPANILPEQEIIRINFMMHERLKQDQLNADKKALQSEQRQLLEKQTRLNLELKMLQKYQEAKQKIQHHQALKREQNQADEWVLQRTESQ